MTLAENVTLNKDKRTGLWIATKGSKSATGKPLAINTANNIQDAIEPFYNRKVR
jgi:hypothetical protein